MKKLFLFGSILFIAVMFIRWIGIQVSASQYRGVQAQAITNNTEYPSETRTQQPTVTLIPSATIGYQETAVIAQQTAMEAVRINAGITAEYEVRIQEQLQMTAEYEQRVQEIYQWTATAALTTIPLTATQQAMLNIQIPTQQAIIADHMTATHEAPTQIVAMINAKNHEKFGEVSYLSGIAGPWITLILVVGVLVFLFRLPVANKSETPERESQLETVVWIRNTKDNGAKSKRMTIPCTPKQLTELAENITQGKKTLGINQWEGKDTLFTRDVILRVRAWLRDNQFVTPTDDGQLAPNNELFDFLCGWLESHQLPTEYEFGEKNVQTPAQIVSQQQQSTMIA